MDGRVGLVTLSLPGERLDLCQAPQRALDEALREAGFAVSVAPEIALSRESLASILKGLTDGGVDAICYLLGTWVDPAVVVSEIRGCRLPALLVSNPAPASFGFTAASAVHGGLDRLGVAHEIFHGEIGGTVWQKRAVPYLRAAVVKKAVAQSTLGLIGGQSPGQSSGNLDLSEVQSIFGLSTVQIDQLVIVDEAHRVAEDAVAARREWLETAFGPIHAPEESVHRSLALMLALEALLRSAGLTFASVKCLADAINVCGSFCLPVSLLNSARQTVSCQGDIPAIILMECLRLLSSEPAFFGDLVTLDPATGRGRLINCGASPVALASEPAAVSWHRQYDYMGAGGGVTARFAIKEGPATLASMSRSVEGLEMLIAPVQVEACPSASFSEIRDTWPQGLVRFLGDAEEVVRDLRSNHVVLGYGDQVAPLLALANMWETGVTVV